VQFHTLNLLDVGSHTAGSEILPILRTPLIAQGIVAIWRRTGLPATLQLDNHAMFRGAVPRAAHVFGPVVATCLDLDVVPRFIPIREPWRNGVVEHFNDVWDKAFLPHQPLPDPRGTEPAERRVRGVPQHPAPLQRAPRRQP